MGFCSCVILSRGGEETVLTWPNEGKGISLACNTDHVATTVHVLSCLVARYVNENTSFAITDAQRLYSANIN